MKKPIQNIGRALYLEPPLEPALFAKTSDGIRIQRTRVRNDKGQNKYTVTLPNGTQYVKEFKFLEQFFGWFEDEVAPFRLVKAGQVRQGRFKKMTQEEKDRLVVLRRAGHTYGQIAAKTGRGLTTLSNYLRQWEKENGEKLNKRAA